MDRIKLPLWAHVVLQFFAFVVQGALGQHLIPEPYAAWAGVVLSALQGTLGIVAYLQTPQKPNGGPLVGLLLIAALLCSPALAQVPAPGGGSTSGGGGGVSSVSGACGITGTVTSSGNLTGSRVVNAQTGTTYTIQASDCGKLVTLTNAGAITLTVPAAGGSFPDGFFVDVANIGSTTVTLSGASGTIAAGASIQLVSTGATWRVLTGAGSAGSSTANAVETSNLAGFSDVTFGKIRLCNDCTFTDGGLPILAGDGTAVRQWGYRAHVDGSITIAQDGGVGRFTIQVTPGVFGSMSSANTWAARQTFSVGAVFTPGALPGSPVNGLLAVNSTGNRLNFYRDAAYREIAETSGTKTTGKQLQFNAAGEIEASGSDIGGGGGVSAAAPYMLSGSDYWSTFHGIVVTRPPSSGWTQVNRSGTPTYSQSNQARSIGAVSADGMEVRSIGANTTLTLAFRAFGTAAAYPAQISIIVRRSATAKAGAVNLQWNDLTTRPKIAFHRNNDSGYVSGMTGTPEFNVFGEMSALLWRISYNSGSTTWTVSYSTNGGATFTTLGTFTDSDADIAGGADQWGWQVGGGANGAMGTLLHWLEN